MRLYRAVLIVGWLALGVMLAIAVATSGLRWWELAVSGVAAAVSWLGMAFVAVCLGFFK